MHALSKSMVAVRAKCLFLDKLFNNQLYYTFLLSKCGSHMRDTYRSTIMWEESVIHQMRWIISLLSDECFHLAIKVLWMLCNGWYGYHYIINSMISTSISMPLSYQRLKCTKMVYWGLWKWRSFRRVLPHCNDNHKSDWRLMPLSY